MSDLDKIKKFNRDQIEHVRIVQEQILGFCHTLIFEAFQHDQSKWSDEEYDAFVASRESLRGSKDGTDEDYQKHLKGEAIQHHILNNSHHPEYWDKIGETMPLHEIIAMFFDWRSRSLQRKSSMDDFWKYNIDKLKNQPHAVPIVEAMKREYCDDHRK